MENNKYNGWSNYATWRINLELVDGNEAFTDSGIYDTYELSQYIRDTCEEYVLGGCDEGSIAYDYAMAFISEVNWYEIASNLNEDDGE